MYFCSFFWCFYDSVIALYFVFLCTCFSIFWFLSHVLKLFFLFACVLCNCVCYVYNLFCPHCFPVLGSIFPLSKTFFSSLSFVFDSFILFLNHSSTLYHLPFFFILTTMTGIVMMKTLEDRKLSLIISMVRTFIHTYIRS